MTKYLHLNNAGDQLYVPYLTFTDMVIDFKPYQDRTKSQTYYAFNTYKTYILNGNDYYQNSTGTAGIYVNDQLVTNNTHFIPDSTRCTLKHVRTSESYFQTYYALLSGTDGMSMDIFDIKFLDNGVLVAHYDMSTGTVNDQSGNGNDATLTGGTWLDSGGATGTPVTYTYDTKQIQYANIQSNYDTKQSIYANRVTQFDTKQAIYKPISQSYDTKQAIYSAIQEFFDTEQVFTQVSNQVSYTYDMKIQQYKDIQESLDTKQAYYTDISVDLDTKQVIYKQIQNLYDTLIQIRNKHDETLYGTLTIQRVIEHRLTINKGHSEDLKIERVLNHILRV